MSLLRRKNLAYSTAERWRPPVFRPSISFWQRLGNRIRRFFDLQAGSIWNDLATELPTLRGKVLDVGCGAQPFRGLLSLQASYFGLDTVDAKEHFGYEMPDTLYYAGNIWPVTDESYDVVVCTETLEHVVDPSTFVGEMHRCLRPGGRLLLTVPFAARWHFIPYDYWRFTPSGLSVSPGTERFYEGRSLRPRKCGHRRVLQGHGVDAALLAATRQEADLELERAGPGRGGSSGVRRGRPDRQRFAKIFWRR